MNDRKLAEVFPPGEFLADELKARGWTRRYLAERMDGDTDLNHCTIDLMIFAPDKGMFLSAETSADLGKSLGVSPEFFLNLDATWHT